MKKNVVSFMNMKGGVGKTTICVNIAGYLSNQGYRVLLIDMDPQMNATQYLLKPDQIKNVIGKEDVSKETIYALYKGYTEDNLFSIDGEEEIEPCSESMRDKLIYKVRENLDIICGDLRMTNVVETDGTVSDTLNLFLLNNNLQEEYDFIFIDCPPTQSIYTISAFKASDFYLLVIKPDYLSTIGLSLFESIIRRFNSRRAKVDRIRGLGIIANLVQRGGNRYHEEKLQEIREKYKFSTVFEHTITLNGAIAQASEEQKLMYETKRCKKPIKDLTEEFLGEYNRAHSGGGLNDRP